ncbi:MAG: DUF4105 domain-containing protein [Myxococcaceae bacterium]
MSVRLAVAIAALCGTTALADVRDELRSRGVQLIENEARLDELDCAGLLLGLNALPEQFRTGALRVEVHAGGADFGMGDELRGVVHLYAYLEAADGRTDLRDDRAAVPIWKSGAPTEDERAEYRLEGLTRDERRMLWRARAIVHAVVRRLDDQRKWSASTEWRLPTGWLAPGDRPLNRSEKPLNTYAWAYSRRLGQRSAALDLATFAEEALVPPSRVNPAHAEPPDDALPCQEFTKLRVLKSFFAKAGAHFDGTALAETPRCELFDEFAHVSDLDHIEVLFSAPSSAGPESLFGHLLVRPVWRVEDELSRAPSFEPVMEIGAFSGVNTKPAEYVWHGLTGQSTTFFGMNGLGVVEKRALEVEQRSLTRYRMNLSKDEQVHVLERMWELERRGYFPYFFFTENCAAYTQLLLDPALAPEHRVGRNETFWVMPLATLDAMAKVTGEGGRPLVERLPVILESSSAVAKREERVAAEQFSALASAPGADKKSLSELDSLRRSLNPADRRRAYESLQLALKGLPSEHVRPLVRALLRVERYAVDVASAREQKVKEKARVITDATKLPTGEELLEWRQRLFQRERPIDRYREETTLTLRLRNIIESLPMRPLTDDEQRTLADAIAIRDAFQAAALLQASFTTPEDNRAMELAAHEEREVRGEAFLSDALRRSGSYRFEFGGGAVRLGSGLLSPGAYLNAAVVAEELGDARVNGFGPEYMVRLGDLRGLLGVQRGLPSVLFADVDVVNFRVLGERPELGRDSILHRVGFGVGLSYAHRSIGGDLNRLLIEGNLFETPLRTLELSSFVSLGAGAAIEIPLSPGGLNSGLRSLLLFRVPLPGRSLANALRGELSYSARYSVLGPDRLQFLQEASASVEAPVFLGRSGAPGWVVHPRFEAYARRAGGVFNVTGFGVVSAEFN